MQDTHISLAHGNGGRFMRDPTRGGLATVCHEISRGTGLRVVLEQTRIQVRDPVQSACEILGYDPLFLACEGRILAVVAADRAEQALQARRSLSPGAEAAIVGAVTDGRPQLVPVTGLGGARILEELEDDPLPRIC